MTKLELIKKQMENSINREIKAVETLQKANTKDAAQDHQIQKVAGDLSKEIEFQEKLALRIGRECITRRAKQLNDLEKKHPLAYQKHLAMKHRRPRK